MDDLRRRRATRLLVSASVATGLTLGIGAWSEPASGTTSVSPSDAPATDLPPAATAASEAPGTTGVRPVFEDPVVQTDALIQARHITAWREGDDHLLLLDGDAAFGVGVHGFRGERMVVRIRTETPQPGQAIRHLAAYVQGARPLQDSAAQLRAQADRLLITAATRGQVAIETDLMTEAAAAPDDALITAARQRLTRYQAALDHPTLPPPTALMDPAQHLLDPAAAEQRRIERRAAIAARRVGQMAQTLETLEEVTGSDPKAVAEGESDLATPAQPRTLGVLPTTGAVHYAADSAIYQRGETEDAVLLVGNVRVMYQSHEENRQIALRAQRVVIFLASGQGEGTLAGQVDAGQVAGVYLEDNAIATDGQFTVRAPRVYYDLQTNRAVLLEAVVYTYDLKHRVPLYLRADVVKQTAATSFEAQDATLTTSEFGEPHFAIRAGRVTVEQNTRPQRSAAASFTAEDITLRWYNLPVFYWPYAAGPVQDIPLQRVNVGYSSENGMRVRTRWDAFALTGREAPQGLDLGLDLDYLGDHGLATGLRARYDRSDFFGAFDGYLVPDDRGTDVLGGRPNLEQEGELRGFYHWQHRQHLGPGVDLSLESAYVSDETFLETFFPGQAAEAKSYETSAYLKIQEENWALTLLGQTDLSDFTAQTTVLQAPGYTVDRAPELGFHRIGGGLLSNRLTWYSENTLSRMRLRFGEDTPADRGYTAAQSLAYFGMPATTSFSDQALAAGMPGGWVSRLDSRQEIQAPLKAGPVNLTPYAIGRVTVYDDDFENYNGQNDDQWRLWGGLGVRMHTSLSRTFDQVHSRLLDLNRLRHIFEPQANLFWSDTTLDATDLPIYDRDVEGLAQGGVFQVGMTNTLQTQRGGPGRWRNVDWIRWNAYAVFRSEGQDEQAPIARYFDQRPEYTVGGDHLYSDLLWLVSDTLGLIGEVTWSLETDRVAHWRVGGTLDHTPRLRSFIAYEEIEAYDEQLLSYGFRYELTTKYTVGFSHRLDLSENESRSYTVTLDRRLPRWLLQVVATVDEIDDEATIGLALSPEGMGRSSAARLFDARGR